jgi:hypothetical protein
MNISDDPDLAYVGTWNGSLSSPAFTFVDGGADPNFNVIGFVPYWWTVIPDNPDYSLPDPGLLLFDWVLTKKEPISASSPSMSRNSAVGNVKTSTTTARNILKGELPINMSGKDHVKRLIDAKNSR